MSKSISITPSIVLMLYDYPQVFIGSSDSGQSYCCMAVESFDYYSRYLCVPISNDRKSALISGRIDLRTVYESPETNDFFKSFAIPDMKDSIDFTQEAFNGCPMDYLPEAGVYFIHVSQLYVSEMILGEGHWQIDIPLMHHETEDEAALFAQQTHDARLIEHNGRFAIQVTFQDGRKKDYFDADISITEVSKEKQAKFGRPLDTRNPDDREIAIDALKEFNPAYVIEESDMVPSDKSLKNFVSRYGIGYRMDNIAWGVRPSQQRFLPGESL